MYMVGRDDSMDKATKDDITNKIFRALEYIYNNRDAIKFVVENESEDESCDRNKLAMPTIAKVAGYDSVSAFHKSFKTETGMTPYKLIQCLQYEKPIQMLIHSAKNHEDITEMYDLDADNFTNQFKRFMRIPPAEYGPSPATFRKIYHSDISITLRASSRINRQDALVDSISFGIYNLVWELLFEKDLINDEDEQLDLTLIKADPDSKRQKKTVNQRVKRSNVFSQSDQTEPRNPLTMVLRGTKLHYAGHDDEARPYYLAAIEAAKDDHTYLNEHEYQLIYAMFLHRMNEDEGMDGDEAEQIAIQVAQNMPDSYVANFYAGLFTLHGALKDDFDNVKVELDGYHDGSYDRDYYEDEIVPLMEEIAGEAAQCERYFTRAIELNRSFAPAYYYRACILDCQNKDSSKDYKRANELNPAFN